MVQGVLLNESTCSEILQIVFGKLHAIVYKVIQISKLADQSKDPEQV